MNELRVLTVCGAGVGTSTLLRMNINDAFKSFALPFPVKVENTSVSRAKGTRCDLVVTFESFAEEAKKVCPDIIIVKNLMDKAELKEKVGEFLKEKNLI